MDTKRCALGDSLWVVVVQLLLRYPDVLANLITFDDSPQRTCGVTGGQTHFVWRFHETIVVNTIRFYNGTVASRESVGSYASDLKEFCPFGDHKSKVTFTDNSQGNKKDFTLNMLDLDSYDAGKFTARFETSSGDTENEFIVEVVDPKDLGRREILVDGVHQADLTPLSTTVTQLFMAPSHTVALKFNKTASCALDVGVHASPVGKPCRPMPAEPVAQCKIGMGSDLLRNGPVNVTLSMNFNRHGQEFHTELYSIYLYSVVTTEPSVETIEHDGENMRVVILVIVIIVIIVVVIAVVITIVRSKKRRSFAGTRAAPPDCTVPEFSKPLVDIREPMQQQSKKPIDVRDEQHCPLTEMSVTVHGRE